MNFSVAFSCSSPHLVCWSPNGLYLAVPDGNKLYIKDGHTAGSLVTSFTCCTLIKMLQWSPDSSLLLTGLPSSLAPDPDSAVLQVWCLTDPEWRCYLELGSAGLLTASWAPDSRHLLVTELLHVRLSVWSLVTRTAVANIRHPKEASPGVQFSCDGAYLAVAERINCRDHLSILDTKTWQLVKQFPVCTRDLAGLAWGRGGDRGTGTIIAVWDNVLTYSLTLYAMCGRALSSVKGAETHGLGVRTACWAPHGNYLLIGGQDTKLCLVNHMTWDISCERVHSPIIEANDLPAASGGGAVAVDEAQRVRVFREVNRALPVSPTAGSAVTAGMAHHHLPPVSETAYSEELCRPVQLATSSSSTTFGSAAAVAACTNHSSGGYSCVGAGYGAVYSPPQGGVSGGVTAVLFSPDGRYLATRVQQLPTVIWLWSLPKLALLAVLVHNNTVRDLSWSPRHNRLVVVTGADALFVWTGFGSLTVAVPRALGLQPIAIRWHPSGSRLLLVGRGGQFSVCGLGASALPPPHRGATSKQRAAQASSTGELRQHARGEGELRQHARGEGEPLAAS